MELYLIEYNDTIIGAYDDFNMAELFINSCIQSKLMTHKCKIIKYKANSCFSTGFQIYIDTSCVLPSVQSNVISSAQPNVISSAQPNVISSAQPNVISSAQPNVISSAQPNVISIDLDKNDAYLKIAKEKSDLLHNLNIIKGKKEKIVESKQIYNNDIKLFELFNINKKSDPNFVIPELFVDKFDIFTKLTKNGTLSWETFIKEWKTSSNNYDDYFLPNNYETKVKAYDSNSSINEELDIETDSDTDSSENN